MAGLGIVLLVAERTGSYRDAGLVSAGYIVTAAISAPAQGWIADRLGQAPVLIGSSLIFALGVVLVLWSAGGPMLTAALCAAVAGLGAPQSGNMARRRWSQLVERGQLNTAFALEAVLDEVVFVIGPVLVTFLTVNVEERIGLLVATLCAVAGSWTMAMQRRTDPGRAAHSGARREPLPTGLLGIVVCTAVSLGVMFGSAEVLVVAFTDEQDESRWPGSSSRSGRPAAWSPDWWSGPESRRDRRWPGFGSPPACSPCCSFRCPGPRAFRSWRW